MRRLERGGVMDATSSPPAPPRDARNRPIQIGDVVADSRHMACDGGIVVATFAPTVVFRRPDGRHSSSDAPADLMIVASAAPPGEPDPLAPFDVIRVRVLEVEDPTTDWPLDEIQANTQAMLVDVSRLIDALGTVESHVNESSGRGMFLDGCYRRRFVSLAAELQRAAIGLIAGALEVRAQQACLDRLDARPAT